MIRGKPGGCHEYGFQHQAGGGTGCNACCTGREQCGQQCRCDRTARKPERHCPRRSAGASNDSQGASDNISRQAFFDSAAGSIVYQVVDQQTDQVVNQFPDEAALRRRAYFHTLDLTKEDATRPVATDRTA